MARVEALLESLQRDLAELRPDFKELRAELRQTQRDVVAIRTTDFRLMFGAIIAVALGLASMMAKGFGWL